MPTANAKVIIAYKTQQELDDMPIKDDNTIYFTTDTCRIFVGNSQYYGIMEYRVVESLPVTGVRGTIYLIAHNHGDNDTYDEYLWVVDKYEKIGNTDIDLSGYIPIVKGANNKIPKFNSEGKLAPTDFELNKTVPSSLVSSSIFGLVGSTTFVVSLYIAYEPVPIKKIPKIIIAIAKNLTTFEISAG